MGIKMATDVKSVISKGKSVMDNHSGLQGNERAAINCLVKAWNRFIQTEDLTEDEKAEFRLHIHSAQAVIMSKPTSRGLIKEMTGQ